MQIILWGIELIFFFKYCAVTFSRGWRMLMCCPGNSFFNHQNAIKDCKWEMRSYLFPNLPLSNVFFWTQLLQFQFIVAQSTLGWKGIGVFKFKPMSFPNGDSYKEMVNIHWELLTICKNWLSKTIGSNFNHTLHWAFFHKVESSLFKWRSLALSKRSQSWNIKDTVATFRNLAYAEPLDLF